MMNYYEPMFFNLYSSLSRSVDYVTGNQSSLEQLHPLYMCQYTDYGSHTLLKEHSRL